MAGGGGINWRSEMWSFPGPWRDSRFGSRTGRVLVSVSETALKRGLLSLHTETSWSGNVEMHHDSYSYGLHLYMTYTGQRQGLVEFYVMMHFYSGSGWQWLLGTCGILSLEALLLFTGVSFGVECVMFVSEADLASREDGMPSFRGVFKIELYQV